MNTGQQRRVEGIGKLQASFPWVDIVDLHISLLGFEVGEGWSTLGSPSPIQDSVYIQPTLNKSLHTSEASLRCAIL
jgi:hypothetical protein